MDIITIVGARPQFVKAATVSRAIQKYNTRHENSISEKIIHTGQHYDANMSDIFFNEMDIPRPLFTLGIGGGSHGSMTGRQLEKIEDTLEKSIDQSMRVLSPNDGTDRLLRVLNFITNFLSLYKQSG